MCVCVCVCMCVCVCVCVCVCEREREREREKEGGKLSWVKQKLEPTKQKHAHKITCTKEYNENKQIKAMSTQFPSYRLWRWNKIRLHSETELYYVMAFTQWLKRCQIEKVIFGGKKSENNLRYFPEIEKKIHIFIKMFSFPRLKKLFHFLFTYPLLFQLVKNG